MKRLKKLPRNLKIKLSKKGKDCNKYGLVTENTYEWVIQNKDTGEKSTVVK